MSLRALERVAYRGLTENDGHENDEPSKLQGMQLQDMKLLDQCAGCEIAGHENDTPKMTAGREVAGEKIKF